MNGLLKITITISYYDRNIKIFSQYKDNEFMNIIRRNNIMIERAKMCECAKSTGKLMIEISDVRDQVKLMAFGNISDIESSNIKRHLELLQRRISSVRNTCDLDTTHQEDIADNISRGIPFMIKKTDIHEFDIEQLSILRNLSTIREQIILKLEDCPK